MPVPSTTARNDYTGNASTTTFAYTFRILAASHLAVYLNGVLQASLSGYSVTAIGNNSGGNVVFVSAPANGVKVTIQRSVPIDQLVDTVNNETILENVFDTSIDKLTMIAQQLDEVLDRTLQAPAGDTAVLTVLPTAAARASLLLGFDGTGAPTTYAIGSGGSSSASAVSFIQSGTGAVGRTVAAKLGDFVSVKDFGAVGDGTTDDTTAIQLALNTGRAVLAPKGTYKLTSTLNVTVDNTGLIGEGKGTVFAPGAGTSDIFSLGDGTNEISGLRFENFTIWPSATRTGGYAFNCRFTTDSVWRNVRVGTIDNYVANGNTHRLYNGWYFDRFSQNMIDGGELVVANDGIKTRGNSDQSFGAELSIDGGLRIVFLGGKGVWLGGASGGIYFNRFDISNCRYGVYCDSTLQPGITNREVFFGTGCTIDSCTGWGINLEATSVALLQANGLWLSACGSVATGEGGIRIAPSAGVNAYWSGCRIQYNYQDGMALNTGAHVISGCSINNNGTGTPGGHGVLIVGSGVSTCTISGCAINNNGNGTRGNGISIGSGADNYSISGNRLFGNGSAQVSDANGPSLTRVIRDNSGWVTENSGTATVANGTSSIVVSHGLSDTPTLVQIAFAGPQDGGAYAYVAPGSITSTQFTITYSTSAGAGRDFYWRAVRGRS